MKILSAKQIYEADKLTTTRQQVSSNVLMERAATAVFEWMHHRLQGKQIPIQVFCGIGNNGGDGLALARHLLEHGYQVSVYVVNYSENRSRDFLINLDRLKERKLWPEFLDEQHPLPEVHKDHIVVDAIFGIGLNREPADWVVQLIQHINRSKAYILAMDIPSGLFMDSVPKTEDSVIKADYVLSFQFPKLPFFLPGTGTYAQQWEVIDIGLDAAYIAEVDTDFILVQQPEILQLYKPREKFSHKGSYGHAVIIGGSYGKIGAVALAARACLVSGAGLVTAYVPSCGYIPLQSAIPEVMVLTDKNDQCITQIAIPFAPSAVGVGMGIGTDATTIKAFDAFLSKHTSPLVIDADGLNILAKQPELLSKLPKQSILTPHPKELERLIGNWKDDFHKLQLAKAFATQHNCVLVVKGAHTVVLDGKKGYINATGNPGMATAGTGDVLAGMLTALLAQGYSSLEAAIFGVYLHGLAGDIAAANVGYESLVASNLIDHIGNAFLKTLQVESNSNEETE